MDASFTLGLNKALCAGYFLSMMCINCILYLFSSFYRKKFNQPSPRAGFIVATILGLFYVFILFYMGSPHFPGWVIVRIVKTVCMAGSAIASGWSSASLFYTMKQTRK